MSSQKLRTKRRHLPWRSQISGDKTNVSSRRADAVVTWEIQKSSEGQSKGLGVAGTAARRSGRQSVGASSIMSGEVSYQIDREIGGGGRGAVFQALNMSTGNIVTIKRVEVDSVRLDAGASIKGEIDVLKKLNHRNIVHLMDIIETEGHLHIAFELMEGSLYSISKRFGNFSEPLTATYMTQVLEGLQYLHEEGLVHRNLKGSNILTTTNGLVKLSDFRVAMNLSDKQAFDVDVVGTPYWMAPEIIQMTGTTTACDLWSMGCTIIELLTGKPPYFDLPQMSALYKIVQDDHPPLPDGITQALRDFLLECFKKQAQMRKSAMELLRHAWLEKPTNQHRKEETHAAEEAIDDFEAVFGHGFESKLHAKEEAGDGFKAVLGHWIEGLIDDDDEETGEKAEQELHSKVGQNIYRELFTAYAATVSADAGSLRHPSKSLHGSTNHHDLSSELRAAGGTRSDVGLTFGRAMRLQGPGAALPGVQEEAGGAERGKAWDVVGEVVVQACVRVCSMLDACPQARHYIMSAGRVVNPLMYLMQTVKPEGSRGEETMANVLAVINKIVDSNLKALEYLAMVGLVPEVIAVLETMGAWEGELPNGRHSGVRGDSEAFSNVGGRSDPSRGGLKMRVEAARLVQALCNGSGLTLQTFISCGGLAVLVQFMGEGPRMDGSGGAGADARRLVHIGIDGVLNVFSSQQIRGTYLCKLFLRLGLVPRIMDIFTRLLGHAITAAAEPGRCLLEREASVAVLMAASGGGGAADSADLVWRYLLRAVEILTTFSKSDSAVKGGMAEDQCLKGIMGALLDICPTYLNIPKFSRLAISLLTVLKNVSMEPSTLEALEKAGAVTTLVSLLGSCAEALENKILLCVFYLCRISRKRQEKAAVAGLIPHLKRCVLKQSSLKQCALQMACDFARASSVVRSLMWDEGLLDFYLSVMRNPQDRYWHVPIFRSLCAWLLSEGETDRVAGRLVEPSNLKRVISLFSTAQQVEFEDVVDKLHLMMDKSPALVKALASSATFVPEVKKRLEYSEAGVGMTLLGVLRQIHEHHPDPQALVRDFDHYKIVLELSQNDSQVYEPGGEVEDWESYGAGVAAMAGTTLTVSDLLVALGGPMSQPSTSIRPWCVINRLVRLGLRQAEMKEVEKQRRTAEHFSIYRLAVTRRTR